MCRWPLAFNRAGLHLFRLRHSIPKDTLNIFVLFWSSSRKWSCRLSFISRYLLHLRIKLGDSQRFFGLNVWRRDHRILNNWRLVCMNFILAPCRSYLVPGYITSRQLVNSLKRFDYLLIFILNVWDFGRFRYWLFWFYNWHLRKFNNFWWFDIISVIFQSKLFCTRSRIARLFIFCKQIRCAVPRIGLIQNWHTA